MTDNLRHWSALEKTDPTATKSFSRAGGFRGTATKPIYQEKKMTEHFGPCGIGWGMDKPEFQIIPADNEILVFCTVGLWYNDENDVSQRVYGVGGDKVVAKRGDGAFVNDEAFKAAFTDALGNAMKHIGVGADVHMGEFDGSKYGRDEPAPRTAAPPAQQRNAAPPSQAAQAGTPAQARGAANGKGTTEHPRRQEALDAYARIKTAIGKAEQPKVVEDIVALNSTDLQLIKQVHPPTYDDLMRLANGRKTELYANA